MIPRFVRAKIVLISIAGKWREILTKVSVIIPVYNVEKYLRECLDSVVNQTLNDIEIICVNDGSPDNSLEILKEYAQKDSRFVIIDRENQGVSKSRNEGIENAQGEFVCFMDPDDYYPTNDILATLYNKAKENNVLICGGEFSSYAGNGAELTQNYKGSFDGYLFEKDGIIEYKDYQFDYGYHRFIYDREFLIKNNIFFPNYVRFQDPPFFVNAMAQAKCFYAVDKITYGYRFAHNKVKWTKKKAKDLLLAITEDFKYSKKYDFEKLNEYTFIRFQQHYSGIRNVIDLELINIIEKMFEYNSELEAYCKEQRLTKFGYYTKWLQSVFSIKNEMSRDKKYKVLTILGIEIKFRRKQYA